MLAVEFNDTITLGGGILIAIATMIGLYRVALGARLRTTNEIQTRTIVALETDSEAKDRQLEHCAEEAAQQIARLNELGAEKDASNSKVAALEATIEVQKEQIAAMPKYQDFMDYTTKMMEHVDSAARARQEQFMDAIVTKLGAHDEHVATIVATAEQKALARHEAQIEVDQEIVAALRELRELIAEGRSE